MCIKLGHKHNIFYLHYFRFQNHSTQRQSFSSYCQRPQPPGQKLKAYFYISMLLYISLKPSQYCTTQINLIAVYQHCSSELSISSLTFLAAAQTLIYREYACSRLQHCSRVNTCTASPQCFLCFWFHQLITFSESFASSFEVCEYIFLCHSVPIYISVFIYLSIVCFNTILIYLC